MIQHVDPLQETVTFNIPGEFAGLHRLPWVQAPGPSVPDVSTVWQRQQDIAWNNLQACWDAEDLPVPSSDLHAHVWDSLASLTRTWISGGEPDEQALVDERVHVLSTFDLRSHEEGHQACFACYRWTQNKSYDSFDGCENRDLVTSEQCQLWTAHPPHPPDLALPASGPDNRQRKIVEDIPCHYLHQLQDLSEVTRPILKWPTPKGVPVMIDATLSCHC